MNSKLKVNTKIVKCILYGSKQKQTKQNIYQTQINQTQNHRKQLKLYKTRYKRNYKEDCVEKDNSEVNVQIYL